MSKITRKKLDLWEQEARQEAGSRWTSVVLGLIPFVRRHLMCPYGVLEVDEEADALTESFLRTKRHLLRTTPIEQPGCLCVEHGGRLPDHKITGVCAECGKRTTTKRPSP